MDLAHCRNERGFELGVRGGEDLVADEEVADLGGGVKREDVGSDPLVGEGCGFGDVDDELVRDHDGDGDVGGV